MALKRLFVLASSWKRLWKQGNLEEMRFPESEYFERFSKWLLWMLSFWCTSQRYSACNCEDVTLLEPDVFFLQWTVRLLGHFLA